MGNLNKVVGVNLLILLVYTAIINFSITGSERSLGVALSMALIISFHVFVDVVVSIVFFSRKKKEQGKAFLLSAGLVLLIGFSACWGSQAFD